MSIRPIRAVQHYLRGRAARYYALRAGVPGMEFDHFGRRVGRRLLLKGVGGAYTYLVNPVSIVRYFELPFALSCLPQRSGNWLDVSSPRLFSLFAADRFPDATVTVINPDAADLEQTRRITNALGLTKISAKLGGADIIKDLPGPFDCAWSISVVEHIAGRYDDSAAVAMMFDALKQGGRLILTVPVDRTYRDEYRESNAYGTQSAAADGKYFFQRVYDRDAIEERLIRPLGVSPSVMRWFGEKRAGVYADYERRWLRDGLDCTVDDPRFIADHYRQFDDWSQMPGIGVCGMMIEKV